MNLTDIATRIPNPEPWSEGEKIPWNDPDFSARMLQEHLSQEHDGASRRFTLIDRHVAWIHAHVLGGRSSAILDLGCGPGLYSQRLAQLGHRCVGLDFSPASIAYAQKQAQREKSQCTYVQQDIRQGDYKAHNAGANYDLAMQIFGEFNVFKPADVRHVLCEAYAALAPGGTLLLEPHLFSAVEREGRAHSEWSAHESGLFSARPHLCLIEHFWDEAQAVATNRYFIVDAASGEVTRHASSMQAYTEEAYRALLAECGYKNIVVYPSLTGETPEDGYGLLAIVARK